MTQELQDRHAFHDFILRSWRRSSSQEVRTFLSSFFAAAFLAVAVGCSSQGSAAMDGGATDLASNIQYVPATIHQIDTDPGNGPLGNGVHVLLDRVVAVTKVDKYVNSVNQQCRYQIWVQDPACTTPPCGLVVKAIGPMAPSATATGKDCPSARLSGTLLDNISRADNVRIRGRIVVEIDSAPPMTVVEHQLFVESLEILMPEQVITPLVISDTAVYGQFVEHLGQTWNQYEGMYVTLQPASGVLTVSAFDADSGFETTPGNTTWHNTFDGDYYPSGATMFPTVGSTYHAISGVVATRKGGRLLPGRNRDFVP